MSFWRLSVSSSSDGPITGVVAFFSTVAGFGTLDDYFQKVSRARVTMNDLSVTIGASSVTSSFSVKVMTVGL